MSTTRRAKIIAYVEPCLLHVTDKLYITAKDKNQFVKNCQPHPAFVELVADIEPPQTTINKLIRLVGNVRGVAVANIPRPSFRSFLALAALLGPGCDTREAKRKRLHALFLVITGRSLES